VSPGAAPGGETPESVPEFTLHLPEPAASDLGLRDEDQIDGTWTGGLVVPERLPQQTLGSVAGDGATDLAAHGQPQPAVADLVLPGNEQEQRTVQAKALPERPAEVRRAGQPLAGPEPRRLRAHSRS